MASKFRNAGQTCVCANRLLIQSGIYEAFAGKLTQRVADLSVGPGLSGTFDQGPLIDGRAIAKAESHVRDAVSHGARVETGGHRIDGPGHFFAPTLLSDVAAEDTDEEAIRLANDTDAGLAAYLFTSSLERRWRIPEALDYGMVGLNTALISTEVAPFGGIKQSGLGREGSSAGMDDYLETRFTCIAV